MPSSGGSAAATSGSNSRTWASFSQRPWFMAMVAEVAQMAEMAETPGFGAKPWASR